MLEIGFIIKNSILFYPSDVGRVPYWYFCATLYKANKIATDETKAFVENVMIALL